MSETQRDRIIDELRMKFSTKTRDSRAFRVDVGIHDAFMKVVAKKEIIGEIIENLMLEEIAVRAGKYKR